MKNIKFKSGFTLIELLVVIAIIGILAAFILASMSESRAQARDAERLNDLKQMQTALELYYNRNKEYPADLDDIGTYIDSVPTDPRTGDSYTYQIENSGRNYAIQASSDDETIDCKVQSGGFSGLTGVQDCPFY